MIAVVPVAAVGVWFHGKLQKAQKQHAGVLWVQEQRGHVYYDYHWEAADGDWTKAEPPGPAWLHALLGVDFFAEVRSVNLDNTELYDLTPLSDLVTLRELAFNIDVHEGTDYSPILTLKHLERLWLDWTHVDEQQLEEVRKALPNCEITVGDNVRF